MLTHTADNSDQVMNAQFCGERALTPVGAAAAARIQSSGGKWRVGKENGASTKRGRRGAQLFSLVFFSWLIAGVGARGATAESNDSAQWPVSGGTSDAQQYSPLRQINENNVQHLGLAWYADIPSADGLVGNALAAGDTIYEAGPGSKIYAHDARSGRQLWIFDPKSQFVGTLVTYWGNQITRGLAIWKDDLYVGTGDCRVVAVNRHTGRQRWEAKSCDPAESYTITGAPRVGGGKVFIGNSSVDAAVNRGFVDAFDAETGRHLWRFYTVPGDPSKESSKAMIMAAKTWGKDWQKNGGANAWDGMTFDPVLNLLYVGTAGPQPQNPLQRSAPGGDALFTDSIVALNADTGEYVWHYQTTPDDAWDFDAMAPILVADIPVKGVSRRVVMQAPKNGFYYVLDAKTGKLLSAENFVPVNWARKVDLKSGRPVENPLARYYENKNGRATVVPNEHGAHNWQAMSYSPQTGLAYIPAMLNAGIYQSTYPLASGVKVDLGAGKSEVKSKTIGQLVAWDPVAQKARWRSNLDLPINGGVMSTAGELVFQGTATGEFFAYQARTGKRIWSWYTGSATQAAPSTVMIDGEQLILLPVGAGGAQEQVFADWTSTKKSRGPARLLAFKLGGTAQLPTYQYSEYFPRPPRPRYPADEVRKGAALFDEVGCSFCHGYQAIHPTGHVPDLRKASKEVHDSLAAIVLGGARSSKGMPSFAGAITPEQLAEIQAYIIDQAWNAYETQERAKGKPGLVASPITH